MRRRRKRSLSAGEAEIQRRAWEIAELLAITLGKTASVYADISPGKRVLTNKERASARAQLEAVSAALRSIRKDDDVIRFAAENGTQDGRAFDMRPTIAVLRAMRRGLILGLSADPTNRANAMPLTELRRLLVPLQAFWEAL